MVMRLRPSPIGSNVVLVLVAALLCFGYSSSAQSGAEPDISWKREHSRADGQVRLHYQHSWGRFPGALSGLNARFDSFSRDSWSPESLPGRPIGDFPQEIRAQYLLTNVVPSGLVYRNDYPILVGAIDNDEHSFLHSADPALLRVVRESGGKRVFFQNDRRFHRRGLVAYALYKIQGCDTNKIRLGQWNNLLWHKVLTREEGGKAKLAPFMEFRLEGDLVEDECFLVRTIHKGKEFNYSLPYCDCGALASSRTPFLTSLQVDIDVSRTSKVPGKPFFDVVYAIEMSGVELGQSRVNQPKVVVYAFQDNCDSELNACIKGFRRSSEYPLTLTRGIDGRFSAFARFSSAQPYMTRILGTDIRPPFGTELAVQEFTAHIVFRIEDGTFVAPQGGFFTALVNYRIQDRIFSGMQTNLYGEDYRGAIVKAVGRMKEIGYNGVYLDEFRPEKTVSDEFTFGWQMAAPAIELKYDNRYKSDPEFDPWIGAMDDLADLLHREVPGMMLIGNTLKARPGYHQALVLRAISRLDGVQFQGCLATRIEDDGVPNVAGDALAAHLQILQRAADQGKAVICLIERMPARLPVRLRLYNMAAFMLIHEKNSRLYLGNRELSPRLLKKSGYPPTTYFPEYDINLGLPKGPMKTIGKYFFSREFERGLVLVNASKGDSRKIKLDRSTRELVLVRDKTNRSPVDMGRLCYPEDCPPVAPAGASISISPGEGKILMY